MGQRHRQLDSLLVAGGQLLDQIVAPIRKSNPLSPLVGPEIGRGPIQACQATDVGNVFVHLHTWVQAALLGHVAHMTAITVGHGVAVPGDRSGIHRHQPHDPAHRGGLARAVWTQKPHQLAARYHQVNASQRNNVAEPLV